MAAALPGRWGNLSISSRLIETVANKSPRRAADAPTAAMKKSCQSAATYDDISRTLAPDGQVTPEVCPPRQAWRTKFSLSVTQDEHAAAVHRPDVTAVHALATDSVVRWSIQQLGVIKRTTKWAYNHPGPEISHSKHPQLPLMNATLPTSDDASKYAEQPAIATNFSVTN